MLCSRNLLPSAGLSGQFVRWRPLPGVELGHAALGGGEPGATRPAVRGWPLVWRALGCYLSAPATLVSGVCGVDDHVSCSGLKREYCSPPLVLPGLAISLVLLRPWATISDVGVQARLLG